MKALLGVLAGASTLVSLALFYSASQRFPQVTAETEQMTAATGGRQVSIVAPAPTAPIQWWAGVASGGVGLVLAIAALGRQEVEQEDNEPILEMSPIPSFKIPAPTPELTLDIPLPSVEESRASGQWTSPLLDPKTCPQLAQVAMSGILVIVGGMGAGKTTMTGAFIAARASRGHKVIVFNHHKAYREYEPFRVYGGAGKTFQEKFDDIQQGIADLIEEIDRRYEQRSHKKGPDGKWPFEKEPITVVLEEFSSYASQKEMAPLIGQLMNALMGDIRKAEIYVIMVTHSLSKGKTGGVSGVVTELKANAPRVVMGSKPAPSGGGFVPTGYCEVIVPGHQPAKNVKVPHIRELVPNPENPLDFTSLVEPEPVKVAHRPTVQLSATEQKVLDLASQREYLTAQELVRLEIVSDVSEAKGIFVSLGRQGLARLNLDNTTISLTDKT